MSKRIAFIAFLAFFAFISAAAQSLQLKAKYTHWPKGETISLKNKPNGAMYRLREELQRDHFDRVPREAEGLLMIICEATPNGWMTLYRKLLSADDYKFIVVFYDKNNKPKQVIDLCQVSNTYDCEVQDVRFDGKANCLMFNMACPTYSENLNGKCSRLFCYDLNKKAMKWQTDFLTSNDIFIFDDRFVYTSYGFTDEKDYVFMFDKETGKLLSKNLTQSAVENMELQEHNGERFLYCTDYNEALYIFRILEK